jgi:hypothetical protein
MGGWQTANPHLKVHLRVPVRIEDDHDVCSVQVDAQAPCTRRQQEDELVAALRIEAVNLRLAVLTGRVACTCILCLSAHASGVSAL